MSNRCDKSTLELGGEALTAAVAKSVLDALPEEKRAELIGIAVKEVLTNNYSMSSMIRSAAENVIKRAVEGELRDPEYAKTISAAVRVAVLNSLLVDEEGKPGKALEELTKKFASAILGSLR